MCELHNNTVRCSNKIKRFEAEADLRSGVFANEQLLSIDKKKMKSSLYFYYEDVFFSQYSLKSSN